MNSGLKLPSAVGSGADGAEDGADGPVGEQKS